MKVSVARRNLFSDWTRLAISVGGVAVAILLMLMLLGVYKGTIDISSAYVVHTDADLWVAQGGTRDMSHTYSIIPASLADEFARIEDVAAVYPLVTRTMTVTINGRENSIKVMGYQPGTGVGGPWKIAEGRGEPGPGEVVIDRVTMKTNGLRLGDTIDIEDRLYRITGVSQDTNVLIFQYAFVDIEETRSFLGGDRVNFLMVKAADASRIMQVREEIASRHPELVVFTRDEFAVNNAAVIREGFLPILAVIVVISFIIGVAIVGLVVYSATLEKYREYGILKAVGASSLRLYGIVFEQSVLSSLIGYAAGAVLAFGVAYIVSQLVAQIYIAFAWTHFASALAAAVVMSVLASWIPIRKVNSIDPMIVFKA